MIEALGFGAAFLVSVLFFLAIALALDASTTQGRSISKAVRPPERPGTPTWTQLPTTDQRLAEQFAPVLELHASEHWPLSSVDGYLRTVELTGRGLHRQHVTADTLPKTCGNSPAPC